LAELIEARSVDGLNAQNHRIVAVCAAGLLAGPGVGAVVAAFMTWIPVTFHGRPLVVCGVRATLRQPGAFLDVRTGVGWLAIGAAHSWPARRVVGIDSWEPALTLAHKNLSQSGVADREELRSQRVEHLDDEKTF
jgi:2-polyprenyl-3-methyl-5-hydroxy-6-metoxy-1,4-benzoquinol methylase